MRSASGPLLEIPVNCESYNLAYVPAVLERAGLEVPATWEQYFATASAVVEGTGGQVRGFAQRGTDAWHTMYTGFATQLWSYGASDFDGGRCAIASPVAVRATSDFIAALRAAGPPDWPDQRWYELALDFARGGYGLIVDSDHYVAYFEDPASSDLVGEIGYALPPLGPTGERRPNLWTWSVVMNTQGKGPAGGVALHRVGDGQEVPAPLGVRGQHEPDPGEHLGGRALPRPHGRLGRVRTTSRGR